jgi:hypothetical protein
MSEKQPLFMLKCSECGIKSTHKRNVDNSLTCNTCNELRKNCKVCGEDGCKKLYNPLNASLTYPNYCVQCTENWMRHG